LTTAAASEERTEDGELAWELKEAMAELGAAGASLAEEFTAWALQDGRPGAEQALVRFGPLAIPHLVRALSSEDRERRRRAAHLLGMFRSAARPAVPVLLEHLSLSSGAERWTITTPSAWAVRRLGEVHHGGTEKKEEKKQR
jgi:hypothetical protein